MGHSHHHHFENEPHSHDHGPVGGRAFQIGILLNITFVGLELYFGFRSQSLSLVADAWHNLGDVAGLAVSLLALTMAARKPSKTFTYGYSKGTILASLANCVLLFIAVGSIGYEAAMRFIHPVMPKWETISLVAAAGILINAATAFLFHNKSELNSKAAYLHMAADAGVSAGVVLGGIIMHYTHLSWIDPLISTFICLIILRGTWGILSDSLRLSMDGVPADVDPELIKQAALKFPEIKDIHHLHIWAMSTSRNALTAHLLLHESLTEDALSSLKSRFKHELLHLNIQHATIEVELFHTADCEEC